MPTDILQSLPIGEHVGIAFSGGPDTSPAVPGAQWVTCSKLSSMWSTCS